MQIITIIIYIHNIIILQYKRIRREKIIFKFYNLQSTD